jgi:tetratricopeptide (TPR) repeat protein
MRMKFIFGLILLFSISLRAAEPKKPEPPSAVSAAQAELKALVARQQELLARADAAGSQAAVEALRPQFQKLVNDYELFLKDYPSVAAGYASYALLLGKPVLDERKRAAALLLKANELDPDVPLVKNQLGNWLAEEGRPLEAVNYFLAAIQLAPEEPLYHYQLGTLLAEASEDFLKSGVWTRAALDKATQEAFRRAAELAPERIEFTYRYGESFYDVEQPDWPAALAWWRALEKKVKPGVEQQAVRLHEANVLLKQSKFAEAHARLATVDEAALQKQKEKLTAQLPTENLALPMLPPPPGAPAGP